jgi:hypothetical protein
MHSFNVQFIIEMDFLFKEKHFNTINHCNVTTTKTGIRFYFFLKDDHTIIHTYYFDLLYPKGLFLEYGYSCTIRNCIWLAILL